MPTDTPTRPDGGAPVVWLAAIAGVTALALALALPNQLFDTNFYSLWEATSLLAGDHPYRDFFEWGIPGAALLSAAVQWLVGYRLVGEFLIIHWTFIITGAVISFDLGYRLTRSVVASLAMALLAVEVLPDTPTFHYPKLFCYPLAIWLCWRYMDRPGAKVAAALGLTTATAFLLRHDHGVYIGGVAVLAFVLARFTVPASRQRSAMVREAAAYTLATALVMVPWMIVVQTNEGLPEYVRARSDLYRLWSADTPYRSFLSMNPVKLWQTPPPDPAPGVLRFSWKDKPSEPRRLELEAAFGLVNARGPDGDGRWQYDVTNVFEPRLFGLRALTENTEGFDWSRLEQLDSWLPPLEPARILRAQITLIIPLLLLGSVAVDFLRSWRTGTPPPINAYRVLLAAGFLAVVNGRLLREASYSHLVAPMTAALCVRFLSLAPRLPGGQSTAGSRLFARARLAAALVVMLATGVIGWVCMQPGRMLDEGHRAEISRTFARLFLASPVDAFVTVREAEEKVAGFDKEAWDSGKVPGWPEFLLRYMHDCIPAGDHVFVSGSTPYHMGYLLERPLAGGHLFWHWKWRSDPVREAQSLALIQSQSVTFAMSTHDPVLEDLRAYPRIREHFLANYMAIPGSHDLLLVDTRRQPVRTFGPYGFPCFR